VSKLSQCSLKIHEEQKHIRTWLLPF